MSCCPDLKPIETLLQTLVDQQSQVDLTGITALLQLQLDALTGIDATTASVETALTDLIALVTAGNVTASTISTTITNTIIPALQAIDADTSTIITELQSVNVTLASILLERDVHQVPYATSEICVDDNGIKTTWLVRSSRQWDAELLTFVGTELVEYSLDGKTWVTNEPVGTVSIGKCQYLPLTTCEVSVPNPALDLLIGGEKWVASFFDGTKTDLANGFNLIGDDGGQILIDLIQPLPIGMVVNDVVVTLSGVFSVDSNYYIGIDGNNIVESFTSAGSYTISAYTIIDGRFSFGGNFGVGDDVTITFTSASTTTKKSVPVNFDACSIAAIESAVATVTSAIGAVSASTPYIVTATNDEPVTIPANVKSFSIANLLGTEITLSGGITFVMDTMHTVYQEGVAEDKNNLTHAAIVVSPAVGGKAAVAWRI